MKKTVVIAGGGITGLAAAYYLHKHAGDTVNYYVVESAPRLGGKIKTVRDEGFTIEAGPDSFLTSRKRSAIEICKSLGLGNELISPSGSGIFVWSNGRLVAMPEGAAMMAPARILPFLRSRLISWPGKIRVGLEALMPRRRDAGDESLGSFVRRRFGREMLDKIAGPMLAGIYSADPDRLSLLSTFPLFSDMERNHGSVLLGLIRQRSARKGAPIKQSSPFLSLRGGLQSMVDELAAQLRPDSILCGTRVITVERGRQSGYVVTCEDGLRLQADAVLLATPAYVSAELLGEIDSALASDLRAIPYACVSTLSFAFERKDIPHPLNGTGFLVAEGERLRIGACTWSSIKFQDRAPEGSVLLRVFLGGARSPHTTGVNEDALVKLALEDLRITMGITAAPILARVYRWSKATPQYEVGHAGRVREIERRVALEPGICLAGATYHGGGLPECIESGQQGARKLLDFLARETNSGDALCAPAMETT